MEQIRAKKIGPKKQRTRKGSPLDQNLIFPKHHCISIMPDTQSMFAASIYWRNESVFIDFLLNDVFTVDVWCLLFLGLGFPSPKKGVNTCYLKLVMINTRKKANHFKLTGGISKVSDFLNQCSWRSHEHSQRHREDPCDILSPDSNVLPFKRSADYRWPDGMWC